MRDVHAKFDGVSTFKERAIKNIKFGSLSKVTVHALFLPVFSFLPRAPQMFKWYENLHAHHALHVNISIVSLCII